MEVTAVTIVETIVDVVNNILKGGFLVCQIKDVVADAVDAQAVLEVVNGFGLLY